MKRQDLILAAGLAFLFTMFMQYYFSPQQSNEPAASGQRVVAPKVVEPALNQPLFTEIDFKDAKGGTFKITTVETEHARYEFSTRGGTLQQVQFRRPFGGKSYFMSTLAVPNVHEHERLSFIVALAEKTPLAYELVSQDKNDEKHTLVYKAPLDGDGAITKTFVVYTHTYRIDCTVAVTRADWHGKTEQPRLFFASPLIADLANNDAITGIANSGKHKVQSIPKKEDSFNAYWARPTLFGAQDRYFVHALVHDADHFAQRGYFKSIDLERMYAILEGPTIVENKTWTLSFYFGPKEDEALQAVDPRLEYTLNYGWFSFLSKPLSKMLLHALNWINKYVHNYGWSLIIISLVFRILLFPFTYEPRTKNEKKRAEYQRKLEYIQQKYKHDPQQLAQERMELMRTHGLPGLGGCVVSLIQLPMFWATSIILANAVELYRAPFLWVDDLSSPDKYYILPLIAAFGFMIHIATTAAPDTRQRISSLVIAVVAGAILTNVASGFLLCVLVSTYAGVVQAVITQRRKVA
ncbi:MAG: membrane protein insertase YidC [Candidatus Babeliales bacterium]